MSRWTENAILAVLGLVVLLFITRAWSGGRHTPSPRGATVLTIVSPHWEGIRYEFKRGFEAWWNENNPAVPVSIEWLTPGGTSQIVRFIESEYAKRPDGIGIDVLFGGGVPPYEYLNSRGFLEKASLPQEILGGIRPAIGGVRLYEIEHRWFGAALSGFGIVFNRQVLRRLDLTPPRTWEDLADPRYIDWVASGHPASSGSVHMLYEVILQAYGFDKGYSIICGMAGNVRAFDEGGNATPRAIGLGEAALGGAIDFYAFEQVDAFGEDNIGFIMPQNLSVISPDPIAVMKGAPNPELASAFLRFVLGESGQKLWYIKKGEPDGPVLFGLNRFPVLTELYERFLPTAVSGNPYSFSSRLDFNYDKSSRRWNILNDLLQATVFDVHHALRSAWRIVGPSGDTALLHQFVRSPVTEDELTTLAATKWKIPAERARIMRQWSQSASSKFRSISGDL